MIEKYKRFKVKLIRLLNFSQSIRVVINKEELKFQALRTECKIIDDTQYFKLSKVILNLTTHGKRINSIFYTLESISNQIVKPNKVILWLDKEEFNDGNLPEILNKYKKRGLTIKYCDDYKSYKKILPSLIYYPNDIIITIDDDIIYSPTLIENLINEHKRNNLAIIGQRVHKIKRDNKGKRKPYNQWLQDASFNIENKDIFITTGGGTLFPPSCFDKKYLDYSMIKESCDSADDVWVKFMSIINGVECIKISNGESFLCNNFFIDENEDIALSNYNVILGGNDIVINKLESEYRLNL